MTWSPIITAFCFFTIWCLLRLIIVFSNYHLLFFYSNIFFSNTGTFPKIWGHPAHTAWALLTQHFYPSDESNPRAKQIKNIHSFNCFIQPASPWIIYVSPNNMSPLSPIFYALFSFWNGIFIIIKSKWTYMKIIKFYVFMLHYSDIRQTLITTLIHNITVKKQFSSEPLMRQYVCQKHAWNSNQGPPAL